MFYNNWSGQTNHHYEAIEKTEKKKPPLAPPRSPYIKERKIRKKVRDDDIKGILDSVIAIVSETDLDKINCPDTLDTDEGEYDETREDSNYPGN